MNFLIIFSFVLLGFFAKKFSLTSSLLAHRVSQYVIYICLPAIVLLKLPKLQLTTDLLFPTLMAWIIILFAWFMVRLAAKRFRWSREIEGCLLLIVCFGNTSFVGFPIIQAFYGEQALVYAVVYDQLGSFLSLAIIGNLILAKYAPNEHAAMDTEVDGYLENKPSVLGIFRKILEFPPLIAILLSFILRAYPLYTSVDEILFVISKTLVPTTMFLVGHHLVFKLPQHKRNPLIFGIGLKMLVLPLVALTLLLVFQQQGMHARVTLMETAMPPMVTATILAIHAKLAPKLAAAAVGYGLLVAAGSLPLIYWVSKSF